MEPRLGDVLAWVGFDGPDDQFEERLQTYADWLRTEGVASGGIGPAEADRVWERHVLDSLMFAHPFEAAPPTIVDVGTGVGLPGIPLACLWPETAVVLLDRSGRRIRLLRRVVRLLGLVHTTPIQADVTDFMAERGPVAAATMRAVLQPHELRVFVESAIEPGGMLVVGAGVDPVPVPIGDLLRFPGSTILEPGRWLRIMRRS